MNDEPTFLILGATGSIGTEVCGQLSSRGYRIAVAGRDATKLNNLSNDGDVPSFQVEAPGFDDIERAARETVDRYGRLDGIANCIGSVFLKPAHVTTPEEWSSTIATNLGSAFATVRAAGRVLRGGGSVVLVSSAAARIGLANHEAIAAAKSGIEGLVRSAAATYARKQLRFNAVAPGLVETPATERITSNPAAAAASRSLHALERFGRPADIASAITWLLDPANSWVTGQVMGVDGGLAGVKTLKP